MFNNREVALAIWLGIFTICILCYSPVRNTLPRLLRAASSWKILLSLALALGYTIAIVFVLHQFGIWRVGHTKDTVYWFLFTAIAMFANQVTASDHKGFAREIVVDSFAPTILVEVVVTAHSFPLLIELLLVPAVVFIAAMEAVSERRNDVKPVLGCCRLFTALIGITLFGFGLYDVVAQFKTVFTFTNGVDILITSVLSIAFIPFVYAVLVVSAYENIFLWLRIGQTKPDGLARAARWRVFKTCGINLTKLKCFERTSARQLRLVTSQSDLDDLFDSSH